ncbi:hypothetical protein EDC01DRAFT_629263 [Geopyxis carbonaria]|nr:hypothetical protein EDC01DRAFT_629263 [Geopyxis carbonaria]
MDATTLPWSPRDKHLDKIIPHYHYLSYPTELLDSESTNSKRNEPTSITIDNNETTQQDIIMDSEKETNDKTTNDDSFTDESTIKDGIRSKRRSKTNNLTIYRWHQRMGHANPETMRKALGEIASQDEAKVHKKTSTPTCG